MGLHDAISSIIERTISWIEHDQLQKANEPLSQPPLSQDMLKQSPHSPPYSNLPPPSNPNPSHNDTETVNGSASHVIATPRNNYYTEATPESGTYPSLSYTDAAPHATSAISYDPNSSFLYAQAAGQVAVAQAQAHAHAQAQAQAQVQTADHNPLTTFATQATQMTQPAHMMWRQQQSSGGNTWQDWTAAVVDNQDRYSANALMSLGSSDPRPGANVDGSTVGLGVSMNGTPATTSATMQWPLLLFSADGVSGA